jgi:hypothetical protein
MNAITRRLPLTAQQVTTIVGVAIFTSLGALALLGYMLWRARK